MKLCTVAGGVESMEQFSRWFFPQTGNSSFYCKYNNKTLQVRQLVGIE